MTSAHQPVGVFDSGIGGLSVLQALRDTLPHERFVYLADSANAPYGEKGDAFVAARTHTITNYLRRHHHIKALVVACNTATAAAIHEARACHPELPLVGVEPALKPAAAITHTGRIGVMGTRGTLNSTKFARLLESLQGQAEFILQPCDGLAHAIERSTDQTISAAISAAQIKTLCELYTGKMGLFGKEAGAIDTLVLGCTHYVFIRSELQALLGSEIQLVDSGVAVARQTQRLLEMANLLASPPRCDKDSVDRIQLLTTGNLDALRAAANRWLHISAEHCNKINALNCADG